jgi:hypothetical protein
VAAPAPAAGKRAQAMYEYEAAEDVSRAVPQSTLMADGNRTRFHFRREKLSLRSKRLMRVCYRLLS